MKRGQVEKSTKGGTTAPQGGTVGEPDFENIWRLLNLSPVAVYICQPTWPFAATFVSPNVRNVVGYGPEAFLGDPCFWSDNVHPEDRKRIIGSVKSLADRPHQVQEYRFRDHEGVYRWVRDELRLVRDEFGRAKEIIGYWIDVTEAREVEARHRRDADRLRLLLQSTGEAIYGLDRSGRCTFSNPACVRMLGYERCADLLGQEMHQLIHHSRPDGSHYPREQCLIHQALESGVPRVSADEVLWRRDGTSFPAEYRAFPILDGEAVVGAVVTFVDITDRKNAERELRERDRRLRELQGELMRASRISAMGQLSSAIAHEIGQPLSAVVNYASVLNKILDDGGDIPDVARSALAQLLEQTERANQILRRLRNFFEKGELSLAPIDVNQLVEEAASLALIEPAARDIELNLRLADDLPSIWADRLQIEQVIVNLVRNSIEAMETSREKKLVVATRNNGEGVAVTVSDTGIGLDGATRERLFTPLYTTKSDGFGVGLSICASIVHGHGGTIGLAPHEGAGASFCFTLPGAMEEI